jgi:WD40 repeat protein
VKLWDVSSGQCIHTFQGHTEGVHAVTFSLDGCILASGSDDQTIRLWNISTGQCFQTFSGSTNWMWAIAFTQQPYPLAQSSERASLDGGFIASSSDDCIVKLWDIKTGQCYRRLKGHEDSVWAVAFSLDGQILASSSDDQTVKLWQVQHRCMYQNPTGI